VVVRTIRKQALTPRRTQLRARRIPRREALPELAPEAQPAVALEAALGLALEVVPGVAQAVALEAAQAAVQEVEVVVLHRSSFMR
jgi:hypothetical protein